MNKQYPKVDALGVFKVSFDVHWVHSVKSVLIPFFTLFPYLESIPSRSATIQILPILDGPINAIPNTYPSIRNFCDQSHLSASEMLGNSANTPLVFFCY